MMRAVGYFRVSDEEQVEGYSLDAQRRAFYEFCAQKGWEVVGIYNEEGRSAWVESIAKRPTFRGMLEASQADKFDVVVTHTLDRFTRNLRVMLDAFHTFSQHNVTYVSITQDIDYTTPEGRLFMTMLGAFAQYFSDALSIHTKKGMRERAMQGMFNGEPPFGYERCDANCIGIDENHTGCHIDPVDGPAMLKTFEKYRSGSHSYRTLAEELNRQGFRTKGRRRSDPDTEVTHDGPDDAKGALFTGWSIRDLLSNRFFLGEVRHKGEYYPGRHQRLVMEDLFNDVQERIKDNRSRKSVSVSRSSRNPHMLTGLLRCHQCGTKLWSQRQGQDGKTYYVVPKKGTDRKCAHAGQSFVGYVFEGQVDQIFGGFTLRPDWVDWIIQNYVEGTDHNESLKRRETIRRKIERAQELYLEGDLTKDRYLIIKENAEAELTTIYVPELDDAAEAVKILTDLKQLWKSADPGQRNRLLLAVFHSIYVDLENREVVGFRPMKAFNALFQAMDYREDVEVWPTPYGEFTRDGGDGGESHSPSRNFPDRICYKRVRRFSLAAEDSRRRDSSTASR